MRASELRDALVRHRPLNADIMPKPQMVLPDHLASRAASILRIGIAVSASLVVAVFVAGNPLTRDPIATIDRAGAPATVAPFSADQISNLAEMLPATRQVTVAAGVSPAPRLVVGRATPGTSGAVLRLGVLIDRAIDDTGLMISGLPVGASLSAGRPVGMDRWYVPAAELPDAVVRPPRDFAGAMDLSVGLLGPENTVTERQSVRLEWARAAMPTTPTAATAADPTRPAAAAFTQRNLEPEEITSLRKRGEVFFAQGDVTAARLMLQRAAEAADARAAFALAATYDPIVLGSRGLQGVTPDPAMARSWYERASAFGSPEAPHRLELLASRVH